MKTVSQVQQQNHRVWQGSLQHYKNLIKQEDPATGGNLMLAGNWGNTRAKEIVALYFERCTRLFNANRAAHLKAFAHEYPEHLTSISYFKNNPI